VKEGKLTWIHLGEALGESNNIGFHLGRMSPHNMDNMEPMWSLLQYSLLRVNALLLAINFDFLERGSYSLSMEEKEKLEAVVAIYRSIRKDVDDYDDPQLELIMESLTEHMIMIDPHYEEAREKQTMGK